LVREAAAETLARGLTPRKGFVKLMALGGVSSTRIL